MATSSTAVERAPGSLTWIQELLLYTAILLTPFQDTGLRVVLRHLGTSFAILPVAACLLIDLGLWLARPRGSLRLGWLPWPPISRL